MKAKILGLLAVGLLAGPMASNAVVVTITGQGAADGQWDVTSIVGDVSNASFLGLLDDQVWWNNSTLASVFASTVGGSLSAPNPGPLFAFSATEGFVYYPVSGVLSPYINFNGGAGSYTYAIGQRVAVPEPGTLALLGLGLAGLGLSRRRKAA